MNEKSLKSADAKWAWKYENSEKHAKRKPGR